MAQGENAEGKPVPHLGSHIFPPTDKGKEFSGTKYLYITTKQTSSTKQIHKDFNFLLPFKNMQISIIQGCAAISKATCELKIGIKI